MHTFSLFIIINETLETLSDVQLGNFRECKQNQCS